MRPSRTCDSREETGPAPASITRPARRCLDAGPWWASSRLPVVTRRLTDLASREEQRVLSQARYCVGGPAATECRTSTEAKTSSQDLNSHGCLPVNTRSSFLRITSTSSTITARGIIKARRIYCCSQPATSYLSPSASCAPVNSLEGCYVSTIGKPHEYLDLTRSTKVQPISFSLGWAARRISVAATAARSAMNWPI